MRLAPLALVLGEIWLLSARTLPIRHFEANIIPLSVTQDRDGLLWVAAAGGVWRFDGLHYEAVEAPAGIDLSGATHIAVGPDGSIWISTVKGLVRYRDSRFAIALPGNIEALIVTRAGRVLATPAERNDLYICTEADRNPCQWSRISHLSVTGEFHEDLDGNVWFDGAGSSICFWSDADVRAAAAGTHWSKLHRIPYLGGDLSDVVASPDHRLWGRNGPDVLRLENGRVLSRTASPVEKYAGVRAAFYLDRRGRVWIPGHKLSLVENGALHALEASPALQDVTAVFQDRRNTLWFGLAGKGLAALPDEASLESWSDAEGLSGSVLDLAVDPALGLIAATDSGALALVENHRRWQPIGGLGRMALRSVAAPADGVLLSLPYRGGLFRAGRELPLPASVNRTRLRKLYRDSHGAIWICGTEGLLRMDPAGHVREVPLPGRGVQPSDLSMDPESQLWVGYEGGVARCLGDNCTPVISPKDGLIDPRIRTIAANASEIWVGYREGDGYSRFESRSAGWKVTHFKPQNGYGPVDTHFLRRDRRGWIWRGSTDGVYVSDGEHTDPEDWIHLTFGDRVNASYAHMYGFLEAADGSIWIGTQAGVVHLHPRADWFAAPPVRVERIAAAQGPDVEIHLSQPGLPPFQSRLFRYRMASIDSQWRFSSDGTLRYPTLPSGAYRLEIASGQGGPPTEYRFRVEGGAISRAPLWVWILVALAAAGLVLALARLRRSAQKSHAAESYWQEKRAFLEDRASEASADAEDWSGRLLDNRFLLEARIASGGFAAVYRALDQANDSEPVAVKILYPLRDHAEWRRRRFEDEVAALQRLQNPGIVRIRHAGNAAADQPYLVMEFIDGITLRVLLSEGPLELERAANLLEQIGEAVGAAHRAGILHRDLKPENVMLRDAGSPAERVKLIDFGIAKYQEETTQTHSTQLAGSSGYVAPERWVGLESYASDIYSLAAIARAMLTDRSLPQSAADLLSAGLDYDPVKRPRDAAAFAHELCGCLLDTLRSDRS